MANNEKKFEISNELRAALGAVQTVNPTDAKKVTLLSFSSPNGQVYSALKVVQSYDNNTGAYKEPQLKIVSSFNGHFVELPLSGTFWKDYSSYCLAMAQALEDVEMNSNSVRADVEQAKKLVAGYRNQ